ncbi:hypothetical protein [Paenibacillus taichungensis]|nr:hypothetical protein [Paenibacillus taichungensis]
MIYNGSSGGNGIDFEEAVAFAFVSERTIRNRNDHRRSSSVNVCDDPE